MFDRLEPRAVDPRAIGDLRVLVVDAKQDGQRGTVDALRERGCVCRVIADDADVVAEAAGERPDAIVLDSCVVDGRGLDVLRELKADHRTALIPVIAVADGGRSEAVLELLHAGADDSVAKPFRPAELLARIAGAARRRALLGGVSPLTGLPGNQLLTREIQARIDRDEPFAFLHVDLDNFKAYNDRYGYVRGDGVIAATAQMLQARVEETGVPAVLGHIGGDDFGIVTTVDAAVPLGESAAAAFDGLSPGFYDQAELDRGRVIVETREGERIEVPLMSVSIGVTVWTAGRVPQATSVADAASEMKAVAKRHPGSHVAVDRRRR